MSPKEKADGLIEKYKHYAYCYFVSGIDSITFDAHVQYAYAKECASIAVDEIIKVVDHTPLADRDYEEHLIEYWQQVKKELKK